MACGFSVQKFSFVGQTASISTTTLFTPTDSDNYIVSITGHAIGYDPMHPGHAATAIVTVGATSEYAQPESPQVIIYGDEGAGSTSTPSFITLIRALSGTPVTINVSWSPASGFVGTQSYDVYVSFISA